MDKLLNGLQHLNVEGLGLNPAQVHVTQEAVYDLQKGLLHAGETFIQQLLREGINTASEFDQVFLLLLAADVALGPYRPRPCR